MDTKDKIKVMQAFVDGETIEFRDNIPMGVWQTCADPEWDWCDFEYRVQPDMLDHYIKDIKGICRIEGTEEVDSELRWLLSNFLHEQGNI